MISIIVPVYNVSKYIERGLNCILAQTYLDYEIIIIDDGSTDDSGYICDFYAQQYKNISVYHTTNNGPGAARNFGLSKATGEYIYFFDIDDEISKDALSYSVNELKNCNADLLIFGYQSIDSVTGEKYIVRFPEQETKTIEEFRLYFYDEFLNKSNGFLWNKIYRKKVLDENNIHIPDLRYQEDTVFNLSCFRFISNVKFTSKVLYTYYQKEKSVLYPDLFAMIQIIHKSYEKLIIDDWRINDSDVKLKLELKAFNGIVYSLFCIAKTSNNPKTEFLRIEESAFTRKHLNNISLSDLSFINRIYYVAIKTKSYNLFCIHNYIISCIKRCRQLTKRIEVNISKNKCTKTSSSRDSLFF